MNKYGYLDKISLATSALYFYGSKYFRESIESVTIQEHLKHIQMDFPEAPDKRFCELKASTLAGDMFPAYRIAQWKSDTYPTIIYHHGEAEEPYDYSFDKIFPIEMLKMPVNFIIARSGYGAKARIFNKGIRSLANYTAMLAVSVQLTEHLIEMARKIGSPQVTVAGLSLGGFVTNLHHTYLNTADCYKPCLAGTSLAEALLNSEQSRLVSPLALKNKEKVKAALEIEEDFQKVDHQNLYPLLARYDQVMLLDRQRQLYPQANLTIIDKGHMTWSLGLRPLREHLLKGI